MRKSRRCRWLGLSVVVAAMVLIAVAPAGALGAGFGSLPTLREAATESPAGPVEPAAPEAAPPTATAPTSTGWIPQGAGTGASSDGAAPIRRGSSLGSGGGPKQAGSTSEEPSYTVASSGYSEPESSTPSTFEEPASTPQAGGGIGSQATSGIGLVKPPATTGRAVIAAIGAATPVTLPESPQGGKSSAPLAAALSLNPRIQGASSSDALPLLAMLVLGLILACAGGRLVVHRWRRRQRWRLEAAEWQAAYRRIQPERAPASKPSESLRRIDLGSEFVIRRAESGGGGSQDPRRAKQKPARAK